MRFLTVATLAGQALATAHVAGRVDSATLNGLLTREFRICNLVPVGPNLCERSCGPGYITCISEPTCYNPSRGDVCCSNGKYCEAGSYCTDIGCCEDGLSLEECGAHSRIATVPVPAPTSSRTTDEPTTTKTSSTKPPTTTTTTTDSSSTSSPTSTSTSTSTRTSTQTSTQTSTPPTGTGSQTSPPTPTRTVPPVSGGSLGYGNAPGVLAIIGGIAMLLAFN
ncbi:hypothetical protein NLG97_g8539 [Lecanicillium saksenae]|uniref:Uncharacterized protein n=1 Tax=Lecanicillium saksenae TaxID=468837 RepID=A0ACC1QKK0_9HYPO|nr:hypothetical protein NLG97_g8539 [Lecanicillium saksenae]